MFTNKYNEKAPVFHGEGIIDVTSFDTISPEDSLGFMCGCDISVFQSGKIEIRSIDNAKDLLESFSAMDIVRTSDNINNYDPAHDMEIAVITENKTLRISFQTKESKIEFCNALEERRAYNV